MSPSLILICIYLALTLLFGGCGSSTDRAVDAGMSLPDGGETFPDPFVIITTPAGPRLTTQQDRIALEGFAVGELEELTYETVNSASVSNKGGVDLKERWATTNLMLSPGDNQITVRGLATGQRMLEDSITVTYNPRVTLGPVSATPPEIFIGQQTPVLVQIQIVAPAPIGQEGVQVTAVDAKGIPVGATLAALADDGQGGDEAAGDGVFSGKLTLAAVEERAHQLRVMIDVTPPAGAAEKALSEVFEITVLAPLTKQDIMDLEATQKLVEETYRRLQPGLAVREALSEVVKTLQTDSRVAEAGLSETEQEIGWTMHSGIAGSFSDYPAGAKGSGAADKLISAILLEPFATEFGSQAEAVPVRDILRTYGCPKVDPIEMSLDQEVTLEKLRRLQDYRLIFIDSHGGVSNSGHVYFTIEAPINWEEIEDPNSQTHRDLKMRRIAVAGRNMTPKPSWTYGVASKFVEYYNRGFRPGSLVYLASCSGMRNSTMAAAFLKGGAQAFTAFTSTVYNAYALAQAKHYFEELRRGKSVSEAVAAARSVVGQVDPQNHACRLACAPTRSDLRITLGCSGYTRVTDGVSYVPRDSTINSNTTYFSLDWLEPDPAQVMSGSPPTVFHVRESQRSCAFSFAETDNWGAAVRKDTGSGALHDIYPSYLDFDPSIFEKRTGIIKLEIDRPARRVVATIVPEPAAYADDDWVTWNRWTSAGLNATEQGGCPFWGPVRDQLQPSIFEASGSDVEISDTSVKVRTVLTNEKGQSTVELDYDLTGIR